MSRIIFALDYPSVAEAYPTATRLAPHVAGFKVGLEMFVSEGPFAAIEVAKLDPVFLDLKLHDIPATVERALRVISRAAQEGHAIRWVSVHASGGREMMRAAVLAARPVKVLAVTVLTSLSSADLLSLGVAPSAGGGETTDAQVGRLASVVEYASTQREDAGFICSPKEVEYLRACYPGRTIVTPGVRPAGADTQDQKRVATPEQAVRDGANYVVVGRPIRDAADPVQAARAINEAIEQEA